MGKTKSPEKGEGKVKKKVKKVPKTTAEAKAEPEQKERPKFSTVEVFSKPGALWRPSSSNFRNLRWVPRWFGPGC